MTTGYVDVAGVRTWHQVAGAGDDPVVLLHGAFAGASSWSAQLPALVAAGWRVHLPERRGHAHTPDVAGPLSYAVMAEDTIAYLRDVVGGAAHLVGWSDGAVVAVLAALRRPELVRRLVLIGQYYSSAGRSRAGAELEDLLAGSDAPSFLRREYDAVSPDGPEHFEVVFRKTVDMVRREPEIELADLHAIPNETLVLQGDRDIVTLAHAEAVVAALPQGRLAVLPGTHGLPVESPGLVNALIVDFLRNGAPRPGWS